MNIDIMFLQVKETLCPALTIPSIILLKAWEESFVESLMLKKQQSDSVNS